MAHLIAPSLLAADFLQLNDQIQLVNDSVADWLHIDVMDGTFVPNISFGQVLMPFIRKASTKPLDVHLMVAQPERYVEQFVDLGASIVTVHYEACTHLHSTLEAIKRAGAKCGVAINPHTSVDLLDDVLEEVDLVCLMSVNPGFGGQKFIYRTLAKISALQNKLIDRNLHVYIEIDGGVGLQNAEPMLQAGATVLVAGSSVFGSKDPVIAVKQLKEIGINY